MTPEMVADRLRRYRRLRQMTQDQLAEAAGTTKAYVGKVEAGLIAEPGMDVLRRLAGALKIPTRELSEPLGIVPIEEADQPDADAFVVGGRNMSALTDADREVVLQVAERLREIAEHSKS